LGRVGEIDAPEGITDFRWDTAPNGKGLLEYAFSPDGVEVRYDYTSIAQLEAVTRLIEDESFRTSFEYNATGDLAAINYPQNGAGLRIEYGYDSGHLATLTRTDTPAPTVLWQGLSRTARGVTDDEILGGVTRTERFFDPTTGRLAALSTVRTPGGPGAVIQSLELQYEAQRLDRITDYGRGREDSFHYDEHNRLTAWVPDGGAPTPYSYDQRGNMRTFGGRTLYYADVAHPNWITSIDGSAVEHDGNGRRIAGPGFSATYTSFHQPRTINGNHYRYDAWGRRAHAQSIEGETYYVDELYEKRVTSTGQSHHLHRIYSDEREIVQITVEEDTGDETVRYVHDGPLGSPHTITDENATVQAQHEYEPYGARFVVGGLPPGADPAEVTTGFTGHEHDDETGLIYMRGRMYDPGSGRFLTPDPLIPGVFQIESLNPYVYVQNSPTNFVDPSGYDHHCESPTPCGSGSGAGGAGGAGPGSFEWYPFSGWIEHNTRSGGGPDRTISDAAATARTVGAMYGDMHLDAMAGSAQAITWNPVLGISIAAATGDGWDQAAAWSASEAVLSTVDPDNAGGIDRESWSYLGGQLAVGILTAVVTPGAALQGAAARAGILRSAGNGSWISRGGLRYGPDPNFGNRVRHVLQHAADIPGRTGSHGVFDAGRRGVLGLVDDAWAIAQRGGSGVTVSTQGARTVYTVDMGRRVGFVGGKAGAAAGNPAASHVRLVLQGNDVVTAFPVIP
jgi:RHS repeat-associated protein